MGNVIHQTVPVQVWVNVDIGIADIVRELQEIPGVRTWSSCQGTIGEGGLEPYRAYVRLFWPDAATLALLQSRYDVEVESEKNQWGKVRPRSDSEAMPQPTE